MGVVVAPHRGGANCYVSSEQPVVVGVTKAPLWEDVIHTRAATHSWYSVVAHSELLLDQAESNWVIEQFPLDDTCLTRVVSQL